ncbi:MAG: RtcB family protein [archaeon]|jgi:tRNA-splicing ligase RtcB
MLKNTKKNIFVDENSKIKIISNKTLFSKLDKSAIAQLYSISKLPSVSNYICGFPDLHIGHGVPVGSAFASDLENNPIISPKAVGVDINCGIRLVRTNLFSKDITDKQYKEIIKAFEKLPIGLSKDGVKITKQDLLDICYEGIEWAVKHSYADKFDKLYTDHSGCFEDASPIHFSKSMIETGLQQLGTLGQGNHFIDLVVVDELFDKAFCKEHKIQKDELMIMLHTGSRGLGFQVASDYTNKATNKEPFEYFDFNSKLGQEYYASMCAAANFAYCNRAVLTNTVVQALEKTLNLGQSEIHPKLLYDLSHNIATIEVHNKNKYLVTRKGAVRCNLPEEQNARSRFFETGTPIILPGSMLDTSHVLLPKPKIKKETFSTIAHGCGRKMSRTDAKSKITAIQLKQDLLKKGIYLSGHSENVLREENPAAYKSSAEVIDSIVGAGLAKKAFSLKPKVVITG